MKQIRDIVGKQFKRNNFSRIVNADDDADYMAKYNALVDHGYQWFQVSFIPTPGVLFILSLAL